MKNLRLILPLAAALAMPAAASAAYTAGGHAGGESFAHYAGDGGREGGRGMPSDGRPGLGREFDGPGHGADGGYGGGHGMTGAVPEPEEWAMMAVGFGLVGYQVRRKQRKLGGTALS